MVVENLRNRVLVYPNKGNLLVSSDIHGNKQDYLQVMKLFETSLTSGIDTYILFLGDLVQGPDKLTERFPYKDESVFIVRHLFGMRKVYGDRVQSLLGNHEHGHIGGVRTRKFHDNTNYDEVTHLEEMLGSQEAAQFAAVCETFPLLALTPAGVVFGHGAPSDKVTSLDDILNVSYSGDFIDINSVTAIPGLDILWRRNATDEEVRQFLSAINHESIPTNVYMYGHDVVEEGFYREGPHHMIISSSFGTPKQNKTILKINLAHRYGTTADLREGHELVKLWEHVAQDERDYSFAEKAFAQKMFDRAEYILRHTLPESYMQQFLLGQVLHKKAVITEDREERYTLLVDAYDNLNKSLQVEEGNADAHLLLGQVCDMIGDANVWKAHEMFGKADIHFRRADTYNPAYAHESAIARARVAEKRRKIVILR
ncbi:hypothetical protein COV17_01835 [Candidatus Woesearchaeota archaeon CG10_big_fil_rev_8_21_14_0_10_36_11]|nr:MAG: hypothetical protein COV17_01835 [Candidatus Woesearchaeota archaeon CG10_big_fil_rev_8_21_14_0_10_36_11]